MKVKKVLIVVTILLLIGVILFVQPLHLVSDDYTRLTMHIGRKVPLVGIVDMAGGYRCYVNNDEYFWLSTDGCDVQQSEDMYVQFSLTEDPILYRK